MPQRKVKSKLMSRRGTSSSVTLGSSCDSSCILRALCISLDMFDEEYRSYEVAAHRGRHRYVPYFGENADDNTLDASYFEVLPTELNDQEKISEVDETIALVCSTRWSNADDLFIDYMCKGRGFKVTDLADRREDKAFEHVEMACFVS